MVDVCFGHSAFGAGVTVPIVDTSNVGVNVGMVGRGVMDAVGVDVGIEVFVLVEIGEGVGLSEIETGKVGTTAGVCPHAVRVKIPPSRLQGYASLFSSWSWLPDSVSKSVIA